MRAVQKILSVLASDSMKIVLLYTSSGVVVFRWQLFKGTYYTVLFGFCKCGMKSQPGARGKTRHVGGRDRGGTIPPHKRGRPVGCRRIPPGGGGGGGVTTDLWNVSEMNPGESWCGATHEIDGAAAGSHICKLLRGGEVTLGVWCWFGFFFLNGELDGFLSFFILLLLAGLNVLSTEGRRQATLRRIWRKGWQSRGMTAMACSPRGRECFELARKRLRRLQCA